MKTGDNSAVAISANARATVRGESAVRGTSSAPGDAPMCAKCPYKKKLEKFEKLAASH